MHFIFLYWRIQNFSVSSAGLAIRNNNCFDMTCSRYSLSTLVGWKVFTGKHTQTQPWAPEKVIPAFIYGSSRFLKIYLVQAKMAFGNEIKQLQEFSWSSRKFLICTTQDGLYIDPREKLKARKTHNILHDSIFPFSKMRYCAARNARHRAANDYTTYSLGSRTGISSLLPKVLENRMCAPQHSARTAALLPLTAWPRRAEEGVLFAHCSASHISVFMSATEQTRRLGECFHSTWPKD